MAVTSLWPIKGRIDHLISYVENPEKTKLDTKNDQGLQDLWNVFGYTTNANKTEEKLYVTGINCLPSIAVEQMIITKKQFDKDEGRLAYHGYQSFKIGEVSPDIAHEIGLKYANEMWGDRFQIVVSTHLDKEHIHNHVAFNSVSFLDGGKYDFRKTEQSRMRTVSDRLCREYGLSVIEHPSKSKTPRPIFLAEKAGKPTRYNVMRWAIDDAIKQSTTPKHFTTALEGTGYKLVWNEKRKYWMLKAPNAQHPINFATLGEGYSRDEITARILKNYHRELPPVFTIPAPRQYRFNGNLKTVKKIGGIRGIYYHYCYLLGIFPKNNPHKPVHPALREDIRHLDRLSAQAKLIWKYKIDTLVQLEAFVDKTQLQIDELVLLRKRIGTILRRKNKPDNFEKLTADRNVLSKQISVLLKQIKTACEVKERSVKIQNNIVIIKNYEVQKKKEQQKQTTKKSYQR